MTPLQMILLFGISMLSTFIGMLLGYRKAYAEIIPEVDQLYLDAVAFSNKFQDLRRQYDALQKELYWHAHTDDFPDVSKH